MKSTDFNKMTERQLEKLDFNDLKKLVSAQGQAANRRIKNIEKSDKTSKRAVNQVKREQKGGRFSVKNKSRDELLREARQIQNFNKSKSGTVKGAVKLKESYEKKALGQTSTEVGKQVEKEERQKRLKEERHKLKEKSKKTGKKYKISKTKRKQINRQARKAGLKAEKEVRRKVETAYEKFVKDQDTSKRVRRGKYYYPKVSDTSDDQDETRMSSPSSSSDGEQVQEFMEDSKESQESTSPFEIDDDDFFVVPDGAVNLHFEVIK